VTPRAIADRLAAIPGVVAVALGGSRARGTAIPISDVDIDPAALERSVTAARALVARVCATSP